MALPKQVQRQIEEAEALQQQLYPTEPQATEPAQEVAPPAVEPESEPAAIEEAPSNVVELAQPAKPEPQPAEQPRSREDDPAYWRQRFKSVQGIVDVEMPRLHAQLKEQSAQIQQLIKQLEGRGNTPEPAGNDLVTSKDAEDFGEDLIDMVKRCATQIVRAEIDRVSGELRKELKDSVAPVADRVMQSETDRFWNAVRAQVADWDVVNNDPSWFEFLDSTPEFSPVSYRVLAQEAIDRGEPLKIASMVNHWRKLTAPVQAPTHAPAPKPELQRQVTPSSSRASAPPAPAGKIWTREDYEAAMDVRNINRLGQVEADRLVTEANLAVAEGRVRW